MIESLLAPEDHAIRTACDVYATQPWRVGCVSARRGGHHVSALDEVLPTSAISRR
jgi:hypothetical protein